jgi:predicted flap endonuclease-1-like 5' DNA nuclease
MAWLSIQIVVEILIAAAIGGVVGWFLHTLYGKAQAASVATKAAAAATTDAAARQRAAELEVQLDHAQGEIEDLRRKSGIARPGSAESAPEGSLAWRNRHLESRVRFLESKLTTLESEAGPAAPKEDHNDEATRLRWRNRYLEGRVKYLEEELLRTGGLQAAGVPSAAASAAAPPPKAVDEQKPELFEQPKDGRADDLKLISGIGPKLEQKLNSLGVWHYAQVAGWGQKEIDWVNSAISFSGRVEREQWVSQAGQLLQRRAESDAEEEPENAAS